MATKRKRRRTRKARWCVYTGKKGTRKHSCHRLKRDAQRVVKRLKIKRSHTGVRIRKLAA